MVQPAGQYGEDTLSGQNQRYNGQAAGRWNMGRMVEQCLVLECPIQPSHPPSSVYRTRANVGPVKYVSTKQQMLQAFPLLSPLLSLYVCSFASIAYIRAWIHKLCAAGTASICYKTDLFRQLFFQHECRFQHTLHARIYTSLLLVGTLVVHRSDHAMEQDGESQTQLQSYQ